jgi:twitching motility two-component system response regulator PilH
MPAPPGPKGRVLLIDAPEQAEMYAEALEHEGYAVSVVDSCASALEAAQLTRPHVIVLDVIVRDDRAWDDCRSLASAPETSGIPIIVLTTSVFDATEAEALEVGASRLLHKPCYPSELVKEIARLLDADRESRRA